MYNWNTNTAALNKNSEKFKIWSLEQAINFGLNGKKIAKKDVKKYFSKLILDPSRAKFIQLLLNGKNPH
ncbi:MAG: hypothetical protein AAB383_00755 [Patescibacteria group bacterium]